MRTQDANLIERAGGERMIARLADAFFIEMLPDHRLARLFKGHDNATIVAQQQHLLRLILSGERTRNPSMAALFAPIAPASLTSRRIKLMVEIMLDCMVEEALPTDVILDFLDRLDALAPGVLTDSTAAWDLGWASTNNAAHHASGGPLARHTATRDTAARATAAQETVA